jgi:hypothetical protein
VNARSSIRATTAPRSSPAHAGPRSSLRALASPLTLVAARARRRPGRWLLTVLGVALAAAFAGAVAAEGTIAGDQAARSVLASLSPLDRTVRVTWQGVVTPGVRRQAQALLDGLGLHDQSEVVLLNPVRLSGIVVRPAAIEPLGPWIAAGPPTASTAATCRPAACPVLLAGGNLSLRVLSAAGVRLTIAGSARLRSAAPLGFVPQPAAGEPPLLLTADAAGLDELPGLSGVYRTHSWLAPLPTRRLNSWQLTALEQRLRQTQAALQTSDGALTLTAPFDQVDAARAQATAAPQRLLLAGGGAIAALAVFILLAAGGLRRDHRADVERLRAAGARTAQTTVFVLAEAGWLAAVALLVGAGLAIAVGSLLAVGAGLPAGGVLTHSLLTPGGAAALAGGWACATGLVAVVLLPGAGRAVDALALAAVAALALALTHGQNGGEVLAVLLDPLCCVACGVLVYRAAAATLRGAERVARRGPVLARVALVGLARAPGAPALAIACIAVSIGLGGFALTYRATLLRGTADQAANQVPLDAIITQTPAFTTALELAPLPRWRAIAGGQVFPVRRTDATYLSGGGTVTVPALGVPAAALDRLRGWRTSDGSAPLGTLGKRLAPRGPVRNPGPAIPAGARLLSVTISPPTAGVVVSAALRTASGEVSTVTLNPAGAGRGTLVARIPPGDHELEALELSEPAGLEITSGHQNAENPAPSTQSSETFALGPVTARAAPGASVLAAPLGGWRAVGAATVTIPLRGATAGHGGVVYVRFSNTGQPGVLRPAQPTDLTPVPVLADPFTAAAAARGGRLTLTVDGLPVAAHVVGVLSRFPTVAPDAGGFVVADESTLAAALDAQLPGQGRPDELWISTSHLGRLQAALAAGPLSVLGAAYRSDIQAGLRSAPIARGLLGTLLAAAAVTGALAVLGLLVALLVAARDDRAQRDLSAQGLGPRALRRELSLRMLVVACIGVVVGLGIAALLTRLAVAAVQAALSTAPPQPPLITVAPWLELAAWGLVALLALAAAILAASAADAVNAATRTTP